MILGKLLDSSRLTYPSSFSTVKWRYQAPKLPLWRAQNWLTDAKCLAHSKLSISVNCINSINWQTVYHDTTSQLTGKKISDNHSTSTITNETLTQVKWGGTGDNFLKSIPMCFHSSIIVRLFQNSFVRTDLLSIALSSISYVNKLIYINIPLKDKMMSLFFSGIY